MNSDEQPDTLAALIAASHNAQLATEHGMVTQIWNDGEITSQKRGDLLWRRSLHQHYPPLPGVDVSMPLRHATNSYAIVSVKDALRIRIAMSTLTGSPASIATTELNEELDAEARGSPDDPRTVIERIAIRNRALAE